VRIAASVDLTNARLSRLHRPSCNQHRIDI